MKYATFSVISREKGLTTVHRSISRIRNILLLLKMYFRSHIFEMWKGNNFLLLVDFIDALVFQFKMFSLFLSCKIVLAIYVKNGQHR